MILCWQVSFVPKASLLDCGWPSSHCSSHGLLSENICVLISSSDDTGHIGLEPTLMTSFQLNHFFRVPCLQVRSHSEVLG